jgi:predicted RNase H-like nuclease (RuvC/YqgF family)
MKRAFMLFALSLSLAGRCGVAQEANAGTPTTAAAIAAQEAAEERYKRMAADVQALQTDNESLKAKIAALEQKIDDLRQLQASAANNSGAQDDLKRLAEKIVQVDKKREEDKQAISEEIRKAIGGLERNLANSGSSARAPSPKAPPETEAPVSGNDLSYTIKDGDTLSVIVHAYNTDFKSKGWKTITLKQAMDANPKVDWARLRVGQKIIIPRPPAQ